MNLRGLPSGGLLLVIWFLAVQAAGVGPDQSCWVCGRPLPNSVLLLKDEVTGVKRLVCGLCATSLDDCYMCSLPVKTNYVDLKDGRFLCERDAKGVLLNEATILSVCENVGALLNQSYSRFMTFPGNVNYHVADRLTLVNLFKIPGKDYTCPNVLGFTSPETDAQKKVEYSISILSGQTQAATESTCAHELTHAWMMANLPPARLKELNRDAIEGFCELVAFVLMRDKNETAQMAVLRTNQYTRGQLDLFIDAEQRFGFSDVMDWMRSGETNRLSEDEIWRIRDMKVVRLTGTPAPAASVAYAPPSTAPLPDRLVLKSISLGGKSPVALINQCTLGVGETGTIKLAGTNLLIRCQAIRADSVLVEVVGSGKTQELRFDPKLKSSAEH
jgi:hypothetical protein